MRIVALLPCMVLLACEGGNDTPPAKVGAGTASAEPSPMLTENKLIAEREERDIDGWVQRQGLTLQRTGTGVRIGLVRDSAGVHARPGQIARVRYTVSLIDGRQCYASAPDKPEDFRVEEDHVESGLHEAIQYLSVGDSAIIVLPSHRAHGLMGDEDKIPMRSTVIYHLGLLGLR